MDYIYIGKIVDTHGIKGELRIRSDFEKKDLVFKIGNKLYLGESKIKEEITSYRRHKDFDMVTFKGYDNINQVLNYLKMNVYVKRSELNLKEDEYILEDLIGMEVLENNEFIGKIADFVYNKSNILLVVTGVKNFYIPYNKEFIKKVDLTNRVVYTENAKGLIL